MSDTAPPLPDTRELRRALGQFATGVTVVTCLADDGTPVGMTANSFSSVSLEPPLVLWSVDRRARSFDAFAAADVFAFSVLAQDQVDLSNQFARGGPDKFDGVAWEPGLSGVPLIAGAAARFECRTHRLVEGGDHLVVLGSVERWARFDRPPLVFAQGRYGLVAPHPGSTGGPDASEAPSRHPYDDFLLPLLFRAYDRLHRGLAPSLAAEDATGAQMRILSFLSANGPTAETMLLRRTMLSRSAYDDARAALLASGTIRGGELLAITAEGEARLRDLLALAGERERHSTAGLDAGEVEVLRGLLRKLVLAHEGDL